MKIFEVLDNLAGQDKVTRDPDTSASCCDAEGNNGLELRLQQTKIRMVHKGGKVWADDFISSERFGMWIFKSRLGGQPGQNQTPQS